MVMKNSTKGFYTLEAAIFLPLVIIGSSFSWIFYADRRRLGKLYPWRCG